MYELLNLEETLLREVRMSVIEIKICLREEIPNFNAKISILQVSTKLALNRPYGSYLFLGYVYMIYIGACNINMADICLTRDQKLTKS